MSVQTKERLSPARIIAAFQSADLPLLQHQRYAIETQAPVVILAGDSGSGRSFTIAPWLLTLPAGEIHALIGITSRTTLLAVKAALRTLEALNLGIEYVIGLRPPKQWKVPRPANLTTYRDTLSLSTGATVRLLSVMGELRANTYDQVFADVAFFGDADVARRRDSAVAYLAGHSKRLIVTSDSWERTLALIPQGGEVVEAQR